MNGKPIEFMLEAGFSITQTSSTETQERKQLRETEKKDKTKTKFKSTLRGKPKQRATVEKEKNRKHDAHTIKKKRKSSKYYMEWTGYGFPKQLLTKLS